MHATYNLWDLARRPVLLEMILKVFPRLSRKLGRIVITPAELYQEYIDEWITYVAKGNEELLDPEGKEASATISRSGCTEMTAICSRIRSLRL
jgi:hypothetical protein